ncbi:Uma2 family endonuclease [Streptomyces sp. NPDC002644]
MSALAVSHGLSPDWDELVRTWEGTFGPEGSKVEIIEGIVTVAPPPSKTHNLIAHLVHRSLLRGVPTEWAVCQTLGTAVPSRSGLYIPDLVVVPERELRTDGDVYVLASVAELVVEITSPGNAAHDRLKKPAGYAQAGVPLYLLIDRWAPGGPAVTLYGEPQGDTYRVLSAGKFGDPVDLPEPFGCVLDTADYPTE